MGNCLQQPGQLSNQPSKSMRLNSFQLIKFRGTWTNPAAKTESIGLLADTPSSWFLHRHLDNFIVTRKSCPSTGTLQKPRHQLARTATKSTTGPLYARWLVQMIKNLTLNYLNNLIVSRQFSFMRKIDAIILKKTNILPNFI